MAAAQHFSKFRTRMPTTSREEPHERPPIVSEPVAGA